MLEVCETNLRGKSFEMNCDKLDADVSDTLNLTNISKTLNNCRETASHRAINLFQD